MFPVALVLLDAPKIRVRAVSDDAHHQTWEPGGARVSGVRWPKGAKDPNVRWIAVEYRGQSVGAPDLRIATTPSAPAREWSIVQTSPASWTIYAALVTGRRKTINVLASAATGAWSPLGTTTVKNAVPTGSSGLGFLRTLRPWQAGAKELTLVDVAVPTDRSYAYRVVLVDFAGRSRTFTATKTNASGDVTYTFPGKAEDVKRVELQSRPINVSHLDVGVKL